MNKLIKLVSNLFGLYLFLFNQEILKAQIVPDSTLPNNSQISIEGNTLTIKGGTTRGNNLFHSFQEFSLPTGWETLFNNSTIIQNIFSRVTGNSISNIDGIIRTNGTANLFFLNPNGIIFGPNARLDIGGSFFASTAERVIFADGFEFDTGNPSTNPLLTNEVPVGLGFAENPGSIRVQGTGYQLIFPNPRPGFESFIRTLSPFLKAPTSQGLEVKPGNTLALIGGDVFLEGGTLSAKNGSIELGSARLGQVNLNYSTRRWNLNHDSVSEYGDIVLSQRSLLDVYGMPGSLHIWANNLSLLNGSVALVQNQSNFPVGDLKIDVTDTFSITGTSGGTQEIRSSLTSETIGLGKGSNIEISARRLAITKGGGIRTATLSYAQGGTININADEVVFNEITPFGSFSGVVSITAGFERGGDVSISTRKLAIENGAGLGSSTYGAASGGNVFINASEKIEISGVSNLDSRIFANISNLTFGSGQGGNLFLFTPELFVNQGGAISSTTTLNEGRGGDIKLSANSIKIVGTSPSTTLANISTTTLGGGQAGNLSIDTDNLRVLNGGGVSTSTFAQGNSGTLIINASNSIEISGIDSRTNLPSFIQSSAPFVREELQNFFRLLPIPTGEPGNLILNAERLTISDRGSISVRNDGTGNAGTIEINAPFISFDSQGSITATTASGQGGNILINSNDLRLNNNSSITATAGGTGNGGNIKIDTDTLTAVQNSDITANAFAGRGGNIDITTQGLFQSPDSDITASSQLGIDGNVEIEVLQPLQPEQAIPTETVSIEQLLSQSCLNRTEIRGTFNYVGNEGIPLTIESGFDRSRTAIEIPKSNSEQLNDSTQETQSVRDNTVVLNRQRPWKIGDPVIEPNQEIKTPDGRIMLVTAISSSPASVDRLICEPMTQSDK